MFNVLQSRLHTNRIFNSLVLESDKHMIQLNKFLLQERCLSPLLLPVRTKMQFYTSLSRAGVRKIKQFYPNSNDIPNSSFPAPHPLRHSVILAPILPVCSESKIAAKNSKDHQNRLHCRLQVNCFAIIPCWSRGTNYRTELSLAWYEWFSCL